jgi:hypothetical protein
VRLWDDAVQIESFLAPLASTRTMAGLPTSLDRVCLDGAKRFQDVVVWSLSTLAKHH